jgi:hypothetical protein
MRKLKTPKPQANVNLLCQGGYHQQLGYQINANIEGKLIARSVTNKRQ